MILKKVWYKEFVGRNNQLALSRMIQPPVACAAASKLG